MPRSISVDASKVKKPKGWVREELLARMGGRLRFAGEWAERLGTTAGAVNKALMSMESDGLVKGELALHSQNFSAGTARYSRAYRLSDKLIAERKKKIEAMADLPRNAGGRAGKGEADGDRSAAGITVGTQGDDAPTGGAPEGAAGKP